MHPALEGGHVQKVHAARIAGREVVLLHVRVPGTTRYVVAAAGLGIGVVGPEGREALREAMRGGERLDKARWPEVVEAAGQRADDDLEARGVELVTRLATARSTARRDLLARALAKAVARVRRRADAVRGDLERAAGADELARRAQLFVVEASRAARGATKLVTVDWTTGEPREIEMRLDPARGAREQIDAAFSRARRLKEGARIGRARLADAEAALAALTELQRALDTTITPDLDALEARARAAAPRDFKLSQEPARAGARSRQAPLPPYRTFLSTSGARILVGRGDARNDALTFHVARPHDLWLHAKNRAGAHVVVPLDRGGSCPADLLVEAAHLAAHFSESRDEDVVEIQTAQRRHLRKPKGSAPGFVLVDREKVLVLRREAALLQKLLEREQEP